MKFKIEDKFKTEDKVVNRGGKHMDVLLGNEFRGFFEQYKDMKVEDKIKLLLFVVFLLNFLVCHFHINIIYVA